MEIKSGLVLQTIDGPFYAPNRKLLVKVIRKSDINGAWLCREMDSGDMLHIQESKLREAEELPKPDDPEKINPS